MNATITVDLLPHELIEYIISFPEINFSDVCHFSRACSKFQDICLSNDLWRRKFGQRWPNLTLLYDKEQHDWRQECITWYTCGVTLARLLRGMSSRFYTFEEISRDAFTDFNSLSEHPLAYHFLSFELYKIIHDGSTDSNLTDKYYAVRVLRYLRHAHLRSVWEEFLRQPPEKQLLERGATLLAQWCQPTHTIVEDRITEKLNALALEVQSLLRSQSPNHPLCQMTIQTPTEMLSESLWNTQDCRTVLGAMNTVLFERHKYLGNRDDYYNPLNSYINEVLERRMGIPITLSIVYLSIAQRLGVQCLPVNCPSHFMLKWKEHPLLPSHEQYTFINVFESGSFISQEKCAHLSMGHRSSTDRWAHISQPVEVFRRMCWNLVEVGKQRERLGDGLMFLQNTLELLSILHPEDVDHKFLLARVYLHRNINLPEVISILQQIADIDPGSTGLVAYMYRSAQSQMKALELKQQKQKLMPKIRANHPNVEFNVGTLMRHRKYYYTCVIYGWDPICTASRDWIHQMGVFNLPKEDKQPFYNVLADDGSNRYVAQENLEIVDNPKPINHPEVGRFFQHFHDDRYVPNAEKLAEYPNDCVRETPADEAALDIS